MKPLLFTLVLLLGACKASGGTEKAASTVDDLKSLRTQLAAGKDSIRTAVSRLNVLAEGKGDMAAEYKAFSKAVDGVASQRERVRSVRESLAGRRQEFIASWNEGMAKIQNASMKDRSKERRDAVVAHFDDLRSAGDETRTEFDEWFSDLVDIRTYLEHDLNPTGITSLEDDIESVTKRAGKIDEALDAFVSELDDLIQAIAAAKPPADSGS